MVVDCENFEVALQMALDGEPVNLEEHCRVCPDCRQEWEQMKEIWSLAAQLPPLEPSSAFRAQVWQKIRRQRRARVFLMAATLLVLLGGLAFLPRLSPVSPGPSVGEVSLEFPRMGPQEWDTQFEVLAEVDYLAEEGTPMEPLPLGDLSQDALAHSPIDLILEDYQ